MTHLLDFSHSFDLFKRADPVFYGAPVVIFVTAPRDNEWAALDIGMCSQNMMLAAKSIGLDSCPVGFGKYVEHTKIFSRLQIPSSDRRHLGEHSVTVTNTEAHKRLYNTFFIDLKPECLMEIIPHPFFELSNIYL